MSHDHHAHVAVKFAIITCSDTRTIAEDTAGAALEELISAQGWTCARRVVVKDERTDIAAAIVSACEDLDVDVVLTCGGSGLSLRDVTPEATMDVCDREVPGVAEFMRAYSCTKTPNAALSRAKCAQRGRVLVVNLPGSERAARENWEAFVQVAAHAVKMMAGEGHPTAPAAAASPSAASPSASEAAACVSATAASPSASEAAPDTQCQLLIDTDWAEEWIAVQRGRKHMDEPDRWNKRSVTFGDGNVQSSYTEQFLGLLDLQPGDTVFDMGCGTGALAIPLAKAGYRVVARDFSEGMLERLTSVAETEGLAGRIDAKQMSWEDDWEQQGLGERFADVAIASRSLITADLGASLQKLSRAARRYACATISTGYTPMMSPTMLHELGVESVPAYDFIYTYNILVQQGYLPEMRFIVNDRDVSFDTLEEGVARFSEQLEHAQTYCEAKDLESAAAALPAWIEERMQPNPNAGQDDRHGGVEGCYHVVIPGDIRWAFLKWDVQ